MRAKPRTAAACGLVALAVAGAWIENRSPDWIHLDPLLQPFGQGPPPAPEGGAARKDTERTPVPVVLRSATVEELILLPGIGPKTADRIVAWRDTAMAVDDLERLQEVHGIGPAKLEALRPWIFLRAPRDSLALPGDGGMR